MNAIVRMRAGALLLLTACASKGGDGTPGDLPDVPVVDTGTDAAAGDAASEVPAAEVPGDSASDPAGDLTGGTDTTDRLDLPPVDALGRDLHFVEVGDPGFGTGVPCEPPCAEGTACLDGRCVGGVLFVEESAWALAGAWVTADGGRADFGVRQVDDRTFDAWFSTTTGDETLFLGSTLWADSASPTATSWAKVQWLGEEFGGHGEIGAYERALLEQLAASGLADALASVPLELGCRPPGDFEPGMVAALLVPWQMLLKYVHADRVGRARAAAERVSCEYSIGPSPVTNLSPARTVVLSNESPVPNVFGYFPFDAEGAVNPEAPSLAIEGIPEGPCGARCRGTCGVDCAEGNCFVTNEYFLCLTEEGTDVNTGYKVAVQDLSCGTALGCQQHDACYDQCNGMLGCDTWDAAMCRRDCDIEACGTWRFTTCVAWAMGGGPQDLDRLEYTYPVPGAEPVEDRVTCPTPDEEMGACWFYYEGSCAGNPCTSANYCIEVMAKECKSEIIGAMYPPQDDFDTVVIAYHTPAGKCPPGSSPE